MNVKSEIDRIEKEISKAESQWLDITHSYCLELFQEHKIISHDTSHHLRTWSHAKELLRLVQPNTFSAEQLLIASMFHDTGLSISKSKKHGIFSRTICERFFNVKQLIPIGLETILNAIEHHDDKEYEEYEDSVNSLQNLQTLLNIADNLDAFSHIGILRYSEIYFMRGLQIDVLPQAILNNAAKRFNHLQITLKSYNSFLEKHKTRYDVLKTFFNKIILNPKSEERKILEFIENKLCAKVSSIDELILKCKLENYYISTFGENIMREF